MVERKLAVQGIVEGLDLDNPIGMDPDTYASVKEYAGMYTPLLQSIASVGDLALRGLNTAAYGVAGAAGDIVGDERLTRDLKAMYQMPFFGAGAAITKPYRIKETPKQPNLRTVTGARVDNMPISPTADPSGLQGLYYNIGGVAKNYGQARADKIPVVRTTQVPYRKAAVDSARHPISKKQGFDDRRPDYIHLGYSDDGQSIGYFKGGRQTAPLTLEEKQLAQDKYNIVKGKLDEGIKLNYGSDSFALSSSKKPFIDVPIDKMQTFLINISPKQRKLIFARLMNPATRNEILKIYPELKGAAGTALAAISTAGGAVALNKTGK